MPAMRALRVRLLIQKVGSHTVLRNNVIYFSGSVAAGVFGYAFHFAVGRLLGPASYGIVASAVAALYLLTLPALILQIVSMRFTSVSAAAGDLGDVRPLLLRVSAVALGVGGITAILVVAGGPAVTGFLQLTDRRVVGVLAAGTILGLLVSTNRGVLQGMRRFVALSSNLMLDSATRVAAAVGLIALGLGVMGSVVALLFGPAIAYAQSFFLLRPVRPSNDRLELSFAAVGRYTVPAAVAVMGVTYLFNADVLLAKHYLAPRAAGIYAAASVLARVVYFLGLTIAGVMFPEVATLHARNQAHFHVVDASLLFLTGVGIVLSSTYTLLPGLVLLPYGDGFSAVKPYLGPFALALTLLALANLLVNYFLSVNSSRFIWPVAGACLLETLLIVSFHDGPGRILGMLLLTMVAFAAALGALYAVERFRKPETTV